MSDLPPHPLPALPPDKAQMTDLTLAIASLLPVVQSFEAALRGADEATVSEMEAMATTMDRIATAMDRIVERQETFARALSDHTKIQIALAEEIVNLRRDLRATVAQQSILLRETKDLSALLKGPA